MAAGDVPGARAAAATLAPFWDEALRARTGEDRARGSGLFGKALRAADAVADAETAAMLLRPFRIEDLTKTHVNSFAKMHLRPVRHPPRIPGRQQPARLRVAAGQGAQAARPLPDRRRRTVGHPRDQAARPPVHPRPAQDRRAVRPRAGGAGQGRNGSGVARGRMESPRLIGEDQPRSHVAGRAIRLGVTTRFARRRQS
jgi:hypothetical protein